MKHLLALIVISSALLISCNKKESAAGSSESKVDSASIKAKASFDAVYAAFNSGKLDELDKYIAADYTEHTPDPGQGPGLAGLKKSMTDFRAAFPDLKFTSEKVFASGDMACDIFHLTGTNTGPMMGKPATGKKMDLMGTDVIRIDANGKGVEHWSYYEEMKFMMQMGMMPPMGPSDGGSMPPPDMKKNK